MSSSTFQNNVVIITGASRGIGQEMARQLADQGAWRALDFARDGTPQA
jgi:NAD(P)-dependent dehydrogenase (short-subunit alcohol dehydrogenase family)